MYERIEAQQIKYFVGGDDTETGVFGSTVCKPKFIFWDQYLPWSTATSLWENNLVLHLMQYAGTTYGAKPMPKSGPKISVY